VISFQHEINKMKRKLSKLIELKRHITTTFTTIIQELELHHKNCTVSKIVGSSVGIVGGAVSVVGIVLAPFTLGLSLGLLAVGAVAGVAGGATAGGASIVELIINDTKVKEVTALLTRCRNLQNKIKDLCELIVMNSQLTDYIFNSDHLCKSSFVSPNSFRSTTEGLGAGARLTFNVAGATLAGVAIRVSTIAVAKTAARVAGAALTFVTLPLDIASLVINSVDLHRNNPTELVKQLTIRLEEIQMQMDLFITESEDFLDKSNSLQIIKSE